MAVLSDEKREALWAKFMSDASSRAEVIGDGGPLNKHELRDAINAVDDWVVANQVSFNLAVPEPARTALSATHKAELFMLVVGRRWEVGA